MRERSEAEIAAAGTVADAGEVAVASPHAQPTWPAFAALVASGCFWGGGFFFGKIALRELGVGPMLVYRFLFGSLALLPFVLVRRERVRRGDRRLFVLAAVLGVPIQYVVQFEGLARTTVSHASLMVGTAPILIAVAAVLFMGERLDRWGWVLLGLSALGAALLTLGAEQGGGGAGGQASALGDGLVVASMLAGVAWVMLSKRLMGPGFGYSALAVNTYVVVLGTVLLAAWVLLVDGLPPVRLSPTTWMAVIVPGVLTTALGSLLWNWGLTRVPATRAGAFVNIEPVMGALLGVFVLGDRPGALALLGGLLIVGSALRFTLRGEATGAPPTPPT